MQVNFDLFAKSEKNSFEPAIGSIMIHNIKGNLTQFCEKSAIIARHFTDTAI